MVNFNLQLCAETWKLLANDIDKLGVQVYITMFQMDPKMRNLFSFKDDVLEESQGLKRHSGILMRTIESSLASAEHMDRFVPYLKGLAQRHAQYGLQPGYFNVLGKSLLLTIAKALDTEWTEEVRNAWESFWSTMESVLTPSLLEAINKPETMKGMYAAPVRSGSKGNVLGQGQDAKREKTTVPNSNLVQETWSIIEQDCDEHGARVFMHFFKLRPDQLQLFSFKDETPLEQSPGLRRHAGIFIRTLGQAVAGLENLTSMLPYLRSLAARHVQYGVTSDLIVAMGNAVFLAIEDGLGEKWTPEVQEAWAMAWAAVESAMTDAIDEVRRGRGELPHLPQYEEGAEAEEKSPLGSLQQDFYQRGVNKTCNHAATPLATHHEPATRGGAKGGESAGNGGPGEAPSLEEDEDEMDELDRQQQLQAEGFGRLRSAASRKQTMKMLPPNLRMVHQEINGLLPTRNDAGSDTSSACGSVDGDRGAMPWVQGASQRRLQQAEEEEEGERQPLIDAEAAPLPDPEAAGEDGKHRFHCKVAPEELAGDAPAQSSVHGGGGGRRCSVGGCAVQ